jgi:DNA-binding Lrp family transcriptional regulator
MVRDSDPQGAPAGHMAEVPVDEVDRRMLAELSKDGRLSIRTLAERVHVSRASCYTRFERLQREGVITGFTTVIDPRRIGPTVSAHVYVKISQHSWKDVRRALKLIPEVEHGALISGEYDLVLFVRTRDADSLRELVLDRLQTMANILSTHTILVFDEL